MAIPTHGEMMEFFENLVFGREDGSKKMESDDKVESSTIWEGEDEENAPEVPNRSRFFPRKRF